jgi:hypothetical protein
MCALHTFLTARGRARGQSACPTRPAHQWWHVEASTVCRDPDRPQICPGAFISHFGLQFLWPLTPAIRPAHDAEACAGCGGVPWLPLFLIMRRVALLQDQGRGQAANAACSAICFGPWITSYERQSTGTTKIPSRSFQGKVAPHGFGPSWPCPICLIAFQVPCPTSSFMFDFTFYPSCSSSPSPIADILKLPPLHLLSHTPVRSIEDQTYSSNLHYPPPFAWPRLCFSAPLSLPSCRPRSDVRCHPRSDQSSWSCAAP